VPKLTSATAAKRRAAILDAARRCFARKGFSATTIADLRAESDLSTGGIYTHFPNKHAIVSALGSQLTEGRAESQVDLLSAFDHLQSDAGETDARVDLHMWAEASADPMLHRLVFEGFDRMATQFAALESYAGDPAGQQLLEALIIGLEVQRALGRPPRPELRSRLAALVLRGLP